MPLIMPNALCLESSGKRFPVITMLVLFLASVLPAKVNATSAAATKHALLIGISDYAHTGVPDLEGPRNDVESLRNALLANWGFKQQNVDVLINDAATGNAIRESLHSLLNRSVPGDHVFIYFSGHASSWFDNRFGRAAKLPDSGGTLIAHDFDPEARSTHGQQPVPGLVVGSRDLQPVLRTLDRDRSVWLVLDASFSGTTVRSVSGTAVNRGSSSNTRAIKLVGASIGGTPNKNGVETDDEDNAGSDSGVSPVRIDAGGISVDPHAWQQHLPNACSGCDNAIKTEAHAYSHLVFFGAAASDQVALDIRLTDIAAGHATTHDGRAHGAFSDALLRVLQDPDLLVAAGQNQYPGYGQVFALLRHRLTTSCSRCSQTPVALPGIGSSAQERLGQSLFQGPGVMSSFVVTDLRAGKLANAPFRVAVDPQLNKTKSDLVLRLEAQPAIHLVSTLSDVKLEKSDGLIAAISSGGGLLTRFDSLQNDSAIVEWMEIQAAVKARSQQNASLASGTLRVQLNNALDAPFVRHGETLTFRIQSDTDAALLVLLVDSAGDLSVLFPANQRELETLLPAGRPVTLPATGETPLVARPPAGTEQLLFYALPPSVEFQNILGEFMANPPVNFTDPFMQRFHATLDQGRHAYGSAHLRINTAP